MNKAQRTVLFGAVVAILAMLCIPPTFGSRPEWTSLWHMYWFGLDAIDTKMLFTQITILLILTTLLTLAFKTPPNHGSK